ncbi:helix-turn-helix domain-containing protein [Gleimia europaea]|uniref:helix-turn-helix domain-containing protein n=1 Tax=Gleimia europaea TaxID=66228 RepID=UPI002657EA39|nr:helix-turn-helix domain-containing protein [Gleimia europaea]MDK7143361.1 helix-turn-helix domain-containing protein [Gleimia europaea]
MTDSTAVEPVLGYAYIPTRLIRSCVLNIKEIAVLLALAGRVDENNECVLAQRTIASDSSCSVRTVRNALAGLERRGLVVREDRYHEDGGRAPSLYRLEWGEYAPENQH